MFRCPTLDGNPHFAFDTIAGRHVLLLFAGSTSFAPCAEASRLIAEHRALFDDQRACFFGVTNDPADAAQRRIAKLVPGIRWFLDYDRAIARLYGVADADGGFRPTWLLLDPMLRVVATAPIDGGKAILRQLVDIVAQPREEGTAPVLIAPRIFDRALCRRLIELHEADGGQSSGFMRDVDGITVGNLDEGFKRRFDVLLTDRPDIRDEIHDALKSALFPLIHRVFQYQVTRIERNLIACYNGDGNGGYFGAHRDNTTAGTSHRRFACSINLNTEDHEGGELVFPEFGSRRYRPPTGGAVVFSCSLLHEAMPVTQGRRYAYLPFFYDEEAARQREEIARSAKVNPDLAGYRA